MISDFIDLALIEQTSEYLRCSISVPDPDLFEDDSMVECGILTLTFSSLNHTTMLEIAFMENLPSLCVGDVYQRYSAVQTMAFLLNSQFNAIDCIDTVRITDAWGEYTGTLADVDKIIRRCDDEN